MATGLTKNQAKTFMQKYLDTNLPSYPGVYYGTYGGSPSSHSNCTLFTTWFLKNCTNLTLPTQSGNGYQTVDFVLNANKGKLVKSNIPKAFSLFSITPWNNNYYTQGAGHTGIVLGIDGNTVITGEANFGSTFGGLDGVYPNNGTVVTTHPLSTFNSLTGVTFIDLSRYYTGWNPNQNTKPEGEEEMVEINKRVMVKKDVKYTVDTLPWGKKGYIKINGIDSFAGRVIDLTQQMGSYLYSPQTKGWTDFKGFEEVETINKTMVVKRAGFTVDQFPWFKGVTRFGVSADYINKEVKVTGKKGAYYYMDNIGWIDEKAFLDDAQATDIKIGDKVMLLETASAYQTGETIPSSLKGKSYTVMEIKNVTQSQSKKAFLLKELMSWVLEQDVKK
ncbi:CHAP domain-containing protein [Enterococcus faecalis]|uniref:CHAP domain-containing protein n=1 Tax=Enterococcus faecalis TaxID=1351 RepID=UPI00232FF2F1|nr:CHAP domain-containing protein [Enterococcus faecalis]MDB7694031.1 CHAP domain-containing protein [Enterococcus faecalis]